MNIAPVRAKYAGHAGHVRQSFADVQQRALTLPDILSSRIQYLPVINWEKCLAWGSKCPIEHWTPAGHFVRQTWNNFHEDCSPINEFVKISNIGVSAEAEVCPQKKKWYLPIPYRQLTHLPQNPSIFFEVNVWGNRRLSLQNDNY